jgi:ribosomal protein S18 acetylase RimI-like enzyme
MIRLIEELSINAWPAAQTLLYDGWVLRFANGYTRRANSINPLYPSKLGIGEKIRACEALYRDKNLPVIFKMTAASEPGELDDLLAGLGYQHEALTCVQVLDLDGWDGQAAASAEFSAVETAEWQAAFARMSGIKDSNQAAHQQILQAIHPQKCFAAVRAGNRVVSCGLGVLQAGYFGLYDIVTDASLRRQGYGETLVRNLLAWAKGQGARAAYLQVMLNNPPALRLYEKVGFREEYRYWYRVRT